MMAVKAWAWRVGNVTVGRIGRPITRRGAVRLWRKHWRDVCPGCILGDSPPPVRACARDVATLRWAWRKNKSVTSAEYDRPSWWDFR